MDIQYVLKFFGVMSAMILADICWALYFIKVTERKHYQAGMWGSAIVLFSGVCTFEYVHDPTLMIAAIVGAFIGTAGTVYFKK